MPTGLSTTSVVKSNQVIQGILLPVHSLKQRKMARSVYKVNVTLPELVQERDGLHKSGARLLTSVRQSQVSKNVYTSFADW